MNVIDAQSQSLGEVFPGVRKPFLPLIELLRDNTIPTCSLMFRRSLLPALPDSLQSLSMTDWPLFIQLASHGDVGCIDEVMASYRRHSAGAWSSQDEASRMQKIIALHEWLLRENLTGNKRAGLSALALWEARRALNQARTGNTVEALAHAMRHLRASARALAMPQWKLLIKAMLAAL